MLMIRAVDAFLAEDGGVEFGVGECAHGEAAEAADDHQHDEQVLHEATLHCSSGFCRGR